MREIMKRSKGKYLIAIGSLLLIVAAILIFFNMLQDKKSGERAKEVLFELEAQITDEVNKLKATEQEQTIVSDDLFAQYEVEEEEATQEKLAEINGDSYIGIVSIPNLGIRLPVMSEWSYANLKISPCRYSGRADENNLIIAAHNYSSHFGNISELTVGDEIVFIAADGKEYNYTTIQTETLNGTDVESLVANGNETWGLTLFTCTLSGQSRVCVRAEKNE